jgi:hypothetical protein
LDSRKTREKATGADHCQIENNTDSLDCNSSPNTLTGAEFKYFLNQRIRNKNKLCIRVHTVVVLFSTVEKYEMDTQVDGETQLQEKSGLFQILVVLSRGFQEFSKAATRSFFHIISHSFEMVDHFIELVRTKKGRRQLRATLRRWSISLGLLESASKPSGGGEEVIVITKTITSADGQVVTIEERKHMRGGQPLLALPGPAPPTPSAAPSEGSAASAVMPGSGPVSREKMTMLEAELQQLRDQLSRISVASAAAAVGDAAASAVPRVEEKKGRVNDENAPPARAAKRGGPPPPAAPTVVIPAKDMQRRTPMGPGPMSSSSSAAAVSVAAAAAAASAAAVALNQSLEQSLMSRPALREVKNKYAAISVCLVISMFCQHEWPAQVARRHANPRESWTRRHDCGSAQGKVQGAWCRALWRRMVTHPATQALRRQSSTHDTEMPAVHGPHAHPTRSRNSHIRHRMTRTIVGTADGDCNEN